MRIDVVRSRDSFLKGALILTGASLVVRFIGVFQKLPLFWLLKEEGVGIYNYPYPLYAILIAFSSTGVNIAVSKLISESLANGDRDGAFRIFNTARWAMGLLGLAGALVLGTSGRFLAQSVHHDSRAALSYFVLAPAVFADTLQASYRGFFQGLQNMRPNALSQVIEQLTRVVVMLLLAYLLLPYGLAVAAAGATFGATAGAFVSFLFLLWVFRYFGGLHFSPVGIGGTGRVSSGRDSVLTCLKRIARYAVPISLGGMGLPIFMLADSALVSPRLQAAGASVAEATGAYGILANNATPLVNLPTILTGALFVALVPSLTESLALGRRREAVSTAGLAVRVTFLFSIPAAVGLYSLAPGIVALLRMGDATAPVVRALTFSLLFLTLQQTTAGILQGLGKTMIPVTNMFIGAGVKAALTYMLVFQMGVNGAGYATAVGFLVASGLNFLYVTRSLGTVIEMTEAVFKPGIAAALMGAVAVVTYDLLLYATGSPSISTLFAIVIAVGAYVTSLALIGGIRSADVRLLPRYGPKVERLLRRLHLLRD